MRAGLLREIITFQEPSNDDMGVMTYHDVKSVRAAYKQDFGSLVNDYGDIFHTSTITFYVRDHWKPTEYMRIAWNGSLYRILSIVPNRTLMQLEIKTEKVNE